MGHILGPKSHVFASAPGVTRGHTVEKTFHLSIAILVRLLLAMGMETCDRECGPFRPYFAVFAILDQFGNTISPWGKGPSQECRAILVAYDRGSIALGFRICSSGLAGVLQLTVRATLPNFVFLDVFCPVM